MFDNLKESWFISKVETVIQAEINSLPMLFKNHTEGVAHAVVMHQYRTDSYPFTKFGGKRLNPYIVAVQSILTFIVTYRRNRQLIINSEDCLGMLKILCLNFMKRLEVADIDIQEVAFIEVFSEPLFKDVFPELCAE